MTNNYLLRLLRCGVSFFTSSQTLHEAAMSATASSAPITLKYCKQNLPSMPVRPSQFDTSLHSRHSLPPSSPPSLLSFSSAHEDGLISSHDHHEYKRQLLARSHSSTKLQAYKLLSFKSLRQRAPASSDDHNHLAHADYSCAKLRDSEEDKPGDPTAGSKYTRSWSSPSLHKRQHIIKLPKRAHSLCSSSKTCRNGSSRSSMCAPKRHVAVYVEAGQERHVVPITYLSHPLFQELLERAEKEYGFRQQGPGLRIPCTLSELRQTLHHIGTQSHHASHSIN